MAACITGIIIYFRIALYQIKDGAPPALQAVRLMAQYLSSPDESRDIVIETLKMWLSDAASCSNPTVQLMAASVFLHEGDLKEAVQTIRNGVTMEQWVEYLLLVINLHTFFTGTPTTVGLFFFLSLYSKNM